MLTPRALSKPTKILLLSYLVVQAVHLVNSQWNTNDFLKREHSLSKPYQGIGGAMPLWDFIGSTMVTPNYIRLTPDHQSKQGAIWNTVPVMMKNWEVQMHFKVHGQGTDLFGDGMAFWYTRERSVPGVVFGYKDFFWGLAIFLDTYSNHNGPHNHKHPYISAMVNNGTLHYDHDRDGTLTMLAGCEGAFRNVQQDTYVAVRYENEKLTVSTDFDNKNAWKTCFAVDGVKLPTGYYFGFSSATGELADNHDVISMKTYDLGEGIFVNIDRSDVIPLAISVSAPRDRIDDGPRSRLSWFKIIFLLVFLVVVCAIGWFVMCRDTRRFSY